MTITDLTFDAWLRVTFDRPVTEPAWYWDRDEDEWDGPPAVSLDYLTRTFENAATILAPFSDAQLNQAFWYVINPAVGGEVSAVFDITLPREDRVRCIRAIYTLFETCFLPRCPIHRPGGDKTATPLTSVVYMWWDLFPSWGMALLSVRNMIEKFPKIAQMLPRLPDPLPNGLESLLDVDDGVNQEVLDVMGGILALPSDACRESALHGLGHWETAYPDEVHAIIDRFLAGCPDLSPELHAYALNARRGRVQ